MMIKVDVLSSKQENSFVDNSWLMSKKPNAASSYVVSTPNPNIREPVQQTATFNIIFEKDITYLNYEDKVEKINVNDTKCVSINNFLIKINTIENEDIYQEYKTLRGYFNIQKNSLLIDSEVVQIKNGIDDEELKVHFY